MKTKVAIFQFKIQKPPKLDSLPLSRVQQSGKASENFVGQIQGLKSSDLEERFGRALDKRKLGYEFRKPYFGGRGTSSEVELDFLVSDGGVDYAFQIDGTYAHNSASQRGHDMLQDARLNQELQKEGTGPVRRIPAWKLDDQQAADRLVREMI